MDSEPIMNIGGKYMNNDEHLNCENLDNDEINEFEYSDLSKKLTKGKSSKLSKEEIKNEGIYFTPPSTIIKNIKMLKPYLKNIKTILEPSCGSCEYVLALNKFNKDFKIIGVENNKNIYKVIESLQNDKITLHNEDFLKFNNCSPDLIIGNPPYFVIDKDDFKKINNSNENDKYDDYFTGRPNIFILFIIKSLRMLNDEGILSFVLPKSFLNCHYYDKTRKYISDHFEILNIVECKDKYIKTQQETIIIIIKKTVDINNSNSNSRYYINRDEYTIFGTQENIKTLTELFTDSTSLKNLEISCKIGNIVWNQVKDSLVDDDTKTLLIYNSNITKNSLDLKTFKNIEKKQYINIDKKSNKQSNTDPVLIINRGNGNGKYHFNYCLINETGKRKYLLENHIIKLEHDGEIERDELIKLYKKIINSFDNDNTKKFINLYFANNAVNTTELCNILPIYDI